MRSPTSRFALVQNGRYEIQENIFVCFVNRDNRAQLFRSAIGFRSGWIMLLGVPYDHINDTDIANAVSSFGKLHYRHHLDGALD